MIPYRLNKMRDEEGLVCFLGATKESLQRNVIEPMQKFWGHTLVSNIGSRNTARVFGQLVHCIGAENQSQLNKLRGQRIKYAYCDEVAAYHILVWEMLISRLSLDHSRMDATLNPEHPGHHLYKFIFSDNPDVYWQQYSIYDNPYMTEEVRNRMERAYPVGSVFHSRLIKGEWVNAEGIIYRQFADNPDAYFVEKNNLPLLREINVGVDFGGTKSGHAFVATGISYDFKQVCCLMSEWHLADGTTPKDIDDLTIAFIQRVIDNYDMPYRVHYDFGEQVLGRGIKKAIREKFPTISVRECVKPPIVDRIRLVTALIGQDRFLLTKDCETLKNALCTALWREKKETDKNRLVDERLDDGSTDIDSIDGLEYSIAHRMNRLIGKSIAA